MASAADRSDAFRNSMRSAGFAAAGTDSLGSCPATTTAKQKMAIPNINDNFGEMAASPPAGKAAIAPTAPEIKPSFELASTSSVLLLTTVGISADRETLYVFCNTSAPNDSGNSNRSSRWKIIVKKIKARPSAVSCMINRRPPDARSMNGPMNGATSAKGAKLTSRYRRTLLRAASGLIEKNNDPASETTIATSPAVINACVLASRLNGETYGTGGGFGGGGRRPVDTEAWYAAQPGASVCPQ